MKPPPGFVLDGAPPPPPGFVADAPTQVAGPVSTVPGTEANPVAPKFGSPEDLSARYSSLGNEWGDLGRGLAKGAGDVYMGLDQLLTRGIEFIAPPGSAFEKWAKEQREKVEGNIRQRNESYKGSIKGEGTSAKMGEVVGGAVPAVGAAIASGGATVPATLPRAILGGTAAGAAGGAAMPVDTTQNPDFWDEKIKQAAIGAGVGAATGGLVHGAGKVVGGVEVTPQVQALRDQGINLTPGQILGGGAKRVEEGLGSVPVVGEAQRAGIRRSIEDMNRSAINRSLEQIGQRLDDAMPVGRGAIQDMAARISDAYDQILPQMTVRADMRFASGITQAARDVAALPDQYQRAFLNTIQRDMMGYMQGGQLTGDAVKTLDRKLRTDAMRFRASNDPFDQQYGDALFRLRDTYRDMMERQNPQFAQQLADVDRAFAMSARIEKAAGMQGAENGVFTPAQLSAAVRAEDRSARKSAFARGDALLQDLSDPAKAVMSSKVPDSGTPFRTGVLAAGVGGLGSVEPISASLLGLSTLPYLSPGMQRATGHVLAARPNMMRRAGRNIRATGGIGALGAGEEAGRE